MDQKQLILEFLQQRSLCVIATGYPDTQQPEAALIGFTQLEDLSLIFGTSALSRKYKNIQANNYVAFVMGGDKPATVQYEGEVTELSPGDELDAYKEALWAKNPGARRFDADPHQRYFKVVPKWIRYIDYTQQPPVEFEITF